MFIPGRIEILGKHTDYCGGRSIVCAIDRGFHAEVEPRSDTLVELENRDSGESVSFDLAALPEKRGHWIDYAVTVSQRLVDNFGRLNGCTIRFRSDLPKAAGLSSSSALMIMVFAALDATNDIRSKAVYRSNISNDIDLAEYLGCIENGQSYRRLAGSAGVGTFGGSQDHAAILLGKPDMLSRFSFCPLLHEADFAFADDLSFVVASSGVIAEKTGAALEKYNRVSRMVSDIVEKLGEKGSLSEVVGNLGFEEIRQRVSQGAGRFTGDELTSRLRQFQFENFEAIPIISNMLAEKKWSSIRRIISMSQHFAERCLANQTPETELLQRSAIDFGAIAASAFGAGFGGSVYAVVPANDVETFREEWRSEYLKRFPTRTVKSEFFTTRPSQIVLG